MHIYLATHKGKLFNREGDVIASTRMVYLNGLFEVWLHDGRRGGPEERISITTTRSRAMRQARAELSYLLTLYAPSEQALAGAGR